MNNSKEVAIPVGLLVAGVAIYVGYGLYAGGAEGAGAVFLAVLLQLAIGVTLGVVACLITANVMSISFGPLSTACLKLAAIFTFPSAISMFIPIGFLAWLVSLVLYFGLLSWLFDLDAMETVVCAVVIWLMRLLAGLIVVGVLLG